MTGLPPLLVLTDRSQLPPGRTLVDQVAACIAGGARAVILREKDLPREERRALGAPIKAALDAVGGALIVASSWHLAADLGAVAVHLADDGDRPDRSERKDERRARRTTALDVGASFHRFQDLWQPSDFGWSYITYSPVFVSASKPGYGPALDIEGLVGGVRELASYHDTDEPDAERVRLYALGGIETPELAAECVAAGADGVAVMGALMRADEPAATTAAFLDALEARGCALRHDTGHEPPRAHAERTHVPSDQGGPR